MDVDKEQILINATQQLWSLHGALLGLSNIFTKIAPNPEFSSDELYGLGQLVEILNRELEDAISSIRGLSKK